MNGGDFTDSESQVLRFFYVTFKCDFYVLFADKMFQVFIYNLFYFYRTPLAHLILGSFRFENDSKKTKCYFAFYFLLLMGRKMKFIITPFDYNLYYCTYNLQHHQRNTSVFK